MSARKTKSDYEELARVKGCTFIGPLPANTTTKTEWICPGGHRWVASYAHVTRSVGCRLCAADARRIPPSEYERVAAEHDMVWLGPYTGDVLEPTNWLCPEGHLRTTTLHSVKRGHRCPICAGTTPKTEADYISLAQSVGLVFVGPVPTDTHTPTSWRCPKGHVFTTSYQHIKGGARCKVCSGHRRKTESDYHDLAASTGLTWLGDLPRNTRTDTLWKCTAGHIFSRRFDTMKSYIGRPERACPICNRGNHLSGPELAIAAALNEIGIKYEMQKRFTGCKLKRRLPFDFYLPDYKALIEYQGEQHFGPTGYGGGRTTPQATQRLRAIQRRDRIKAEFAHANSYRLFLMNYTEDDVVAATYRIVKVLQA